MKDGRMVGQWIQSDLWGIYQQLTAASQTPTTTVSADPPLVRAKSAR
jgi:hypothetical protein